MTKIPIQYYVEKEDETKIRKHATDSGMSISSYTRVSVKEKMAKENGQKENTIK